MVQPATNLLARRVSLYEATAILFIIAIIWIDEILDIPYVLLGGPATPINWRESLFESVIILIIGALSWMSTARLVRAEALSIKERTFVGYAKYIGEKPAVVIFRHILPGAIGTIIVVSTATVSGAIMTESALGFLGLGVPAPLASWGSLLSTSKGQLATAPHLAIVPGLLIAITVFCVNVIGNGLRSAIMREESR